MKITGVSNIINIYSDNQKVRTKSNVEVQRDSIEISSLGKSLSTYSIDNNFINSDSKINQIKSEVQNGTYNRDSKLIAQKMLDIMKNRGF